MAETLFEEVPSLDSAKGMDQIAVDFMDIVYDSYQVYTDHFEEIKKLYDLKDDVSDTDDPSASNKRTNVSLPYKATNKMLKQFSKPQFQMFAAEASENTRAVMQGLVEDALRLAGWVRVLEGKKNGAQRAMLETGDGIVGCGSNPFGSFPFQYYTEENSRVFTNIDAREMRNPGSETEVRKIVVVKEYQWEQAVRAYPELAGNASLGLIPAWEQIDPERYKELQDALQASRRIQLAFCYDIDYEDEDGNKGLSRIVAGSNGYSFNEKTGKEYQWRNRFGDPEKPFGQLVAFPRTRGFWNYGILQTLYKLGQMHSKLMNQGITYTLINTNPVRVMDTNMSELEAMSQLSRAMKDGAEGKIPMMVAADGREFGGVTTTAAPPVIDEANAMLDILEKDLAQMGINLNDIVTDKTKTLGALQLEVAAATDLVKYIQNTNASEYEFLIEQMLYYLRDRKMKDNKISLVSSVKIRKEDGAEEEVVGVPERDELGIPVRDEKGKVKIFRSFNLEDLKEMLRLYEWKVVVIGGVVNNPVLEDALDRNIQLQFPGTRASRKAAAAMYQRHGRNYSEDDFTGQISGAQQEAGDKV